MKADLTLAELSEASGVPARTIRFYISRGVLAGPVKAGRAAAYTEQHLSRLTEIKALQSSGRLLADIARAHEPVRTAATPWWQYAISDEVVVSVRADVSPWRAKQIRSAIEELACSLRAPDNGKGE
jgi:DNA-binding transcriptional MerR regulator